jgi:coproporphyrinogen III oxidase-like Fe-S oxidoreductase
MLTCLPWAEFISSTCGDQHYFPIEHPEKLNSFRKADFDEIAAGWKKTLSLMREGAAPPEIGLYLNWPLGPLNSALLQIEAVKKEVKFLQNIFKEANFTSLHIGGGSPSYLPDNELDGFLSYLKSSFKIQKGAQVYAEITQPMPSVSQLNILLGFGFNHITLRVDSFDEALSESWGGAREIKRQAADIFDLLARAAGVSAEIDLMIGARGQTESILRQDVRQAFSFHPQCVYLYSQEDAPHTLFPREKKDHLWLEDDALAHSFSSAADALSQEFGYVRCQADWKNLSLYPLQKEQEAGWRRSRASTLGIGFGTLSHAFGSLWYYHGGEFRDRVRDGLVPDFYSMGSSSEEEMRGYVIEVLSRGPKVSREAFRALFKRDILDVGALSGSLLSLNQSKIVSISERFIEWADIDSPTRAVWLKSLYSPTMIKTLFKSAAPLFRDFSENFSRQGSNWREYYLKKNSALKHKYCRIYYKVGENASVS